MDFFGKYQSPFGYQNGDNGVDSYGVDHSGFSTQDELQYQNLRLSRENELANDMARQGIAQCDYPQYGTGFWGNNLSNGTNYDISRLSPTVQAALNLARSLPAQQQTQQSPMRQVLGGTMDMVRNYFDMKSDNTIGGDDYFHCKGNYEAAQRGMYGKLAAKVLGNEKEVFDYFKNRYYKGMSYPDALADYWHDRDVNFQARELVDNPFYSDSKEACRYQRVEGINEKY